MKYSSGSKIDLSISIVSFNTKNLLEKCLTSIFQNTKNIKFEVLVVDNGSNDGTVTMVKNKFPQVKLIKNKENLFFSKAYNQALKKASGEYILILNSDTIIPKKALEKIIEFLKKHPKIGAASCKHIDNIGRVDSTCSRSSTPKFELLESSLLGKLIDSQKTKAYFRYQGWKRDSSRQVDVLPGSFIMIRSTVLDRIGLLDENLKLFYSDTDFCLRIQQAGFALFHMGDVSITHLRAQTVNQLNPWERYKLSESDMLKFYKKHFGIFWWLFLWLAFRPNWLYWRLKSFSKIILDGSKN